ncbi:MAG TPA: efflux RND transporter permease subunit [Nocardioidaceae bacterium]|nr:efflux RND transporter permease subunit [Nocardioidaceae bacterium]
MMRWIVGSSLKLQKIILAAAVGVVALGIYQVSKTPVDLMPEYQKPTVEVQTEALGLSASEVEQLITVPLEQDLLVGVPFLDDIRSVSLPGLSSVVMTFEKGTDVLDARQMVQERLTQAVGVAGLPAVAKTPQMIQPLSSNSRVSMIKLTAEDLSPIEMSVLARWVVGPRLLGVPGVANVSIWGNRERQLQVLVDPERLRQRGVALSDVVRTSGNALEVSPLSYLEASKPGTGGFIDTPNQRLNIFHEQAISKAGELAQVPLEGPGGTVVQGDDGPLALGDVTEVVEGHQPLIGDTACGGGADCLLLVVEKFPDANTGQVADDVDSALAALGPGLGGMEVDSSLYRPAAHIESTFSSLGWALLAGGVLLVGALLLLLRDWRRTAVVLSAMIVSMAGLVLLLQAWGSTVNLLVLAGLAVAVTVLVDDAVTDTLGTAERIARYRQTGTSAPVWPAIVESTVGLRRSALFAALLVGAAALPLFFLRDEGAAFVPPIAVSYLVAMAVSFAVALLLTPALSLLLLSQPSSSPKEPLPRLHRRFDAWAPKLFTRSRPAVVAVGVIVLAGVAAIPFLDVSLRPEIRERDVVVQLAAPAGTSLPRMTAIAEQAVEDLASVPGVTAANAQIGRAVMSDRDVDVNEGEIWLSIDADADYDATVAAIEDTFSGDDAVSATVTTYTDSRVRTLFPEQTRDVAVRVYGENPDVLQAKSEEIRAAVAGVDGVTGVTVESTPTEETLQVQVDMQRAQALGVKPGDVRRAAAMLVGGVTVGNLFQEQKVFDVVVWGAPEIRDTAADLRQLLIDTPAGDTIPLGQVAEVRETETPAVIRHENVARYVDVSAGVAGRSVADVGSDVTRAVAAVEFPLDHHAEVLGDYADARATTIDLVAVGLAAGLVVYLLLQAAFRSWRLAGVAFLAIPVALVGALTGTLLTGGTITLGVLAGMVAVLGLAARGIMSTILELLRLQRYEEVPWGTELVVRGMRQRLLPLVTTTLAIAAVMTPLAVAAGRTGFELIGPAALSVLGGLVTTTVVNALVIPVVALRFGTGPDSDAWVDDLYEPVTSREPIQA